MLMTARFAFRCEDSVATSIGEIAERTGLSEAEVIRRLVRLGLQDVDEIDDEVLFGTAAGPKTGNVTE